MPWPTRHLLSSQVRAEWAADTLYATLSITLPLASSLSSAANNWPHQSQAQRGPASRLHRLLRGVVPHWRGIYDDRGRVMLVVEVNSATSDSWEWADDPNYPRAWAGPGFRIAIH